MRQREGVGERTICFMAQEVLLQSEMYSLQDGTALVATWALHSGFAAAIQPVELWHRGIDFSIASQFFHNFHAGWKNVGEISSFCLGNVQETWEVERDQEMRHYCLEHLRHFCQAACQLWPAVPRL